MTPPPDLNVVCWRGTNGFGPVYHLEETERPGRTLCNHPVPESGVQRHRTDDADTCRNCLEVLEQETRKRLTLERA